MDENPKPLKGTTTVGIVFDKGVVLAADKRATVGTFIAAKEVQKIHMIADRIALTMAGGVGDAQQLARLLRAELELYRHGRRAPMSVQGAATLLSNILQGSKYFPYFVQMIIAGVDTKPKLYDLDPFGGLLEENYVSTGSGSVVAYGVLDESFHKDMGQEEAARVAAKAVAAAMRRDSATGEGIDVLVITRDSAKFYPQADVKALVA
jgi:proteasome beta subunit